MTVKLEELDFPYVIADPDQVDRYPPGKIELRLYVPPPTETEKQLEQNLLQSGGIAVVRDKDPRPKKILRFAICQLECFALWQADQSGEENSPLLKTRPGRRSSFRALPLQTSTRDVRKSRQLAIRALYSLGYDLGLVDVGVFSVKPRYRVWRMSNRIPPGNKEALNRLIERQVTEYAQHHNPVLGADLEFVLRHRNGKYVLASNYFPKLGRVGYDSIWIPGRRNKHPIAELRPKHSPDPRELFKNIFLCLRLAERKINNPDIQWLAGGKPLKGFPIGGHLHFSGVPLNTRFVRALDNYLTLPLFLMESPISLSRRPKYGYIGDIREQFHGGFEYRTPPSWLVRPRIAKGVVCLAKVLANDYQHLEWMPLNNWRVQTDFYQEEQDKLRGIVHQLWQELKLRCPSYREYQHELDPFYQLIEAHYRWDEYQDIRPAWRLTSL
ncbi:hypothetical protein GCM10010965_02560 [Caldalkalibacillus thermarum]|uniref:putative amidoligase domain-containing protein n=1 Tax=Caldalkalibacillus thermarum TaxID=296745 RepID=UPI001665ECF3|nr:hypothetical protein [Caldalkalibacillus thermarum]GGK13053.1 hypothetical protein GCM10010965_02560 [Caldalkalibacillus thermarum]